MNTLELAERAVLPDCLIRLGIKRLLRQRLHEEHRYGDLQKQQQRFHNLLAELRQSPIALATEKANEQHYEVPSKFYLQSLGEHLKYSSCYWPEGVTDLGAAEEAMLTLSCERAELQNGQQVLELGCGWGSLSLWMASKYPGSNIVAVSNSNTQRSFIESTAQRRGLGNIRVITCDMNDFDIEQRFDRVVSVEMFEHMRNYEQLMQRISGWLKPEGKLFVHIFCHRYLMYPFETDGANDWMGRYFFTGGLMPAADTLLHFQEKLRLQQRWIISGTHYQKTLEAWLQKTDRNKVTILDVFRETYGSDTKADRWLQRWRIFFMACAELFGYRQGSEWMVAHYLFANR